MLFPSRESLPRNKKGNSPLPFGLKCRAYTRDSFTPDLSTLNFGDGDKRSMTHPGCQATTFSDLRMERIANIREAIANGSYFISSADLAHKLMSYAQR